MNRSGAMDIAMGTVTAPTSVPVDPLEPVLSTMAGGQVLKIISGGDALSLSGTKEVILDGVCVVAKRNFDRAFEAM